jgi:hypothetical protein
MPGSATLDARERGAWPHPGTYLARALKLLNEPAIIRFGLPLVDLLERCIRSIKSRIGLGDNLSEKVSAKPGSLGVGKMADERLSAIW